MSINDTRVDRRRVFRLALRIVGIGAAAPLGGCEILNQILKEEDDEDYKVELRRRLQEKIKKPNEGPRENPKSST